ncbi:MAG: (Fe-S)-binding protein [candidate division KSB1 bacterium]|nr:(Fe-S)-binding protein [candidate division KSB1 bacterium]MDZ7384820.1 (Fe-S)-binding protein [candidate division KSB1 bacterium]MDZ7393699.1 (Fe-S)-binding protein [candidate division KSB1 bacterium]MDZ7412484.1 (Fe-S)-binding protein [candidate division KSB1 bacterium]
MKGEYLKPWLNELITCTLCGYCKNVCPPFDEILWDGTSARGRNILAYGMLTGEIEADQSVAQRIYECTMCGDCERRCPSKVKVPQIVRAARAELVDMGLAFPGQIMLADNVMASGNIFGDQEVMLPKQEGEVRVFIGCQFLARPNKVKKYLKILEMIGIKPKVQEEVCCGFPLVSLGFVHKFEEHKERLAKMLKKERTITFCPTCTVFLKEEYGIPTQHFLQAVAEKLPADKVKKLGVTVTYHDPCDLARGAKVTEEPRRVLAAIGAELKEMSKSKNTTRCCGGGGGILSSNEQLSGQLARNRVRQAMATGAKTIVTSCATCEQTLKKGAASLAESGEGEIVVRDVADLVWDALRAAGA